MEKKGERGFEERDKVTVIVKIETGEVTWLINGQERQRYKMEKIKNKSIEWVPYIRMFVVGTKVEIME